MGWKQLQAKIKRFRGEGPVTAARREPTLLHTLPETFSMTEKHCLFVLIAVLVRIPSWLISSLSFRLSQNVYVGRICQNRALAQQDVLMLPLRNYVHLTIWLPLPYDL